MKKTIITFVTTLLLLELLIFGLGQFRYPLLNTPLNYFFPLYACFLHLSALVLFKKYAQNATTGLSVNSTVKILGYLIPLAIILFTQDSKSIRIHFIAVIFLTYIAFSVLNVVLAIRQTKSFSQKGDN